MVGLVGKMMVLDESRYQVVAIIHHLPRLCSHRNTFSPSIAQASRTGYRL